MATVHPSGVSSQPVPSLQPAPVWSGALTKLAITTGVGVVLALLPAPAGLEANAWRYFALFVAVIIGLILEPIPAAAVGLVGVALAAVFGLVFTPEQLADPKTVSTRNQSQRGSAGVGGRRTGEDGRPDAPRGSHGRARHPSAGTVDFRRRVH